MASIETVNVSAHIPIELANKLTKIAKFEERNKSYYIKKSLEKFLAERLEDIEDYFDAKEAWEKHENSGEKTVSFKELFKDIE